jgi:hypothetical protein
VGARALGCGAGAAGAAVSADVGAGVGAVRSGAGVAGGSDGSGPSEAGGSVAAGDGDGAAGSEGAGSAGESGVSGSADGVASSGLASVVGAAVGPSVAASATGVVLAETGTAPNARRLITSAPDAAPARARRPSRPCIRARERRGNLWGGIGSSHWGDGLTRQTSTASATDCPLGRGGGGTELRGAGAHPCTLTCSSKCKPREPINELETAPALPFHWATTGFGACATGVRRDGLRGSERAVNTRNPPSPKAQGVSRRLGNEPEGLT